VRLDEALSAQRRFTTGRARASHAARRAQAAGRARGRAPDDHGRASALAELGRKAARRIVEQLLTMARLEPEAPERNAAGRPHALSREAIVARAAIAAGRSIDLD
jgi:two-component system OmpR family sensor kinase